MSGGVFASFIETTFPEGEVGLSRKSTIAPSNLFNRKSPADPFVFEGFNEFGQKRLLINVKSEIDQDAIYTLAAEIGVKEFR